MRLVARMPDQRQVGALVDSLKNIGLDRADMVISDLADIRDFNNVEGATDADIAMNKTERDSLDELEPFAEGVRGLRGDEGIIVAVKAPKHELDKIRSIMEQSGAVEIIQD